MSECSLPTHIFKGAYFAFGPNISTIWKHGLGSSTIVYDPIQWSSIFKTYEDFIYKPSRINRYSKQAKRQFTSLTKDYRRKTGIVTELKGFR